jgi:hypothetical protein
MDSKIAVQEDTQNAVHQSDFYRNYTRYLRKKKRLRGVFWPNTDVTGVNGEKYTMRSLTFSCHLIQLNSNCDGHDMENL